MKVEEIDRKRLKARLFPHGNHNIEKDSVRMDSTTAQLDLIRMMCSVVTILNSGLGCLEIKGEYIQSDTIQSDIYVRPPPELQSWRGIL